jgi:hypothetical protein
VLRWVYWSHQSGRHWLTSFRAFNKTHVETTSGTDFNKSYYHII